MRQIGWTHGWQRVGIASLVLLVAMLAAVMLRLHWEAQTAVAMEDIERARSQAMQLAAERENSRRSTPGSSADPWANLPGQSAHSERLTRLLNLGSRVGLQAGRVEQTPLAGQDGPVEQFQVVASFQGPYVAVRAFIESALAADSALSLDRLRLSRASPDAPTVEAETSWSFVQRRRDPAQGAPR